MTITREAAKLNAEGRKFEVIEHIGEGNKYWLYELVWESDRYGYPAEHRKLIEKYGNMESVLYWLLQNVPDFR